MEKNRINIAELLKDCPKGMELDCTMFRGLEFDRIDENNGTYPIICRVKAEFGNYNVHTFTEHGCYSTERYAKCTIFPKGKTTWEGFHRPFKDGDILATDLGSVFYLNTRLNTDECYGCYVGIGGDGSFHICAPFAYKECCGFATEEEKEKLFKAIKDKGYKWNAKTKTLEKFIDPKFKIGDKVVHKNNPNVVFTITGIEEDYYINRAGKMVFQFSDQDNYELVPVEPIFKVGDKITNGKTSITIGYIDDEYYYEVGRNIATRLLIKNQDEWNLIPKRFDINTLIPFESKVLVRHNKDNKWCGSFFSFIDRDFHSHCYKFVTTANKSYPMMIPYKGNEYLLGKVEDCDDYYKVWE